MSTHIQRSNFGVRFIDLRNPKRWWHVQSRNGRKAPQTLIRAPHHRSTKAVMEGLDFELYSWGDGSAFSYCAQQPAAGFLQHSPSVMPSRRWGKGGCSKRPPLCFFVGLGLWPWLTAALVLLSLEKGLPGRGLWEEEYALPKDERKKKEKPDEKMLLPWNGLFY